MPYNHADSSRVYFVYFMEMICLPDQITRFYCGSSALHHEPPTFDDMCTHHVLVEIEVEVQSSSTNTRRLQGAGCSCSCLTLDRVFFPCICSYLMRPQGSPLIESYKEFRDALKTTAVQVVQLIVLRVRLPTAKYSYLQTYSCRLYIRRTDEALESFRIL